MLNKKNVWEARMCKNCDIYHFSLPVEWCCVGQASSGTWESLSLTTSMTKWSLTFLLESGETAMTGTRQANGCHYYLKMHLVLFLCVSTKFRTCKLRLVTWDNVLIQHTIERKRHMCKPCKGIWRRLKDFRYNSYTGTNITIIPTLFIEHWKKQGQ